MTLRVLSARNKSDNPSSIDTIDHLFSTHMKCRIRLANEEKKQQEASADNEAPLSIVAK